MSDYGSSSPDHYRAEVARAEAHARSMVVTLVVLAMLIAGGIWWFVDHYFGEGGVRVVGILLGLVAVIAFIVGLGMLVMWVSTGMVQRHHDNVLDGLVAFQREDDRGEVARTVATGITGVLRSGNAADARMLAMADRLSRERMEVQQQLADSQRQDREWQEQGSAKWDW